ncbi:MAG: oligosaccharide flippase family protein [Bacteroidota bacterium]|nr:MAG: oligosaccharide flippase family protein [Bacteroidota bacterium]
MLNQNKKISTDLIWYLIGTALPMLTLFVRSPIYTRIFSPEEYSSYSLIYISFTYISAISFQGITNNAWRYFLKYKKANISNIYYSTLFLLFLISAIIILGASTIWLLFVKDIFLKRLIILGFFYAISNEFFMTLFVPARLEKKAGLYNIVNSLRAILSFGLLLLLTFRFTYTIDAFFIAPSIINILFIIPLILYNTPLKNLVINLDTIKHSKRFLKYGAANLFYNLGLFLLISSDRFIILLFEPYDKIGIYNQTYNIGQVTIAAIFLVFNSAINPFITEILDKRPNSSDEILSGFFRLSFIIFLPVTVILSIFSKEIVFLLLGDSFREAWQILPFIFLSSFILGLNYFAVLKIKFKNDLKTLMFTSLFAATVNIFLNLLLIWLFGYKMAATTTFLAYLILAFLLYRKSNLTVFDKPFKIICYKLLISCLLSISVHILINKWLAPIHVVLNVAIQLTIISVVFLALLKKDVKKLIAILFNQEK